MYVAPQLCQASVGILRLGFVDLRGEAQDLALVLEELHLVFPDRLAFTMPQSLCWVPPKLFGGFGIKVCTEPIESSQVP